MPAVEVLEERLALDVAGPTLDTGEVASILDRAAAASASETAIIAIVDRNGRILGVRVEQGVLNAIPDLNTLIFAIDGAVAKARTGAFFGNNEAPLTSRTIAALSQSTITEREVESNPSLNDANSSFQGPGLVAAIGTGGHFPPGVRNTPSADLFGIEQTNRDSMVHPGLDGFIGTGDDIILAGRFNSAELNGVLYAPESYGRQSGLNMNAQGRGISTLPGGIPIYENGTLVGGIGVFFPGSDGFATHEQGFQPNVGQTKSDRLNASQVLEAEWIAYAAVGGSTEFRVGDLMSADGTVVSAMQGFVIPATLPDGRPARIDLAGITLDLFGPGGLQGAINTLLATRARVGVGLRDSGADQQINAAGDLYQNGITVSHGFLVAPKDAAVGNLKAADVLRIIQQGIIEAGSARAQIRGLTGTNTKMVFAVADLDGTILGLYRMADATVFSIDVAVAKARNMAYYNSAALQNVDQLPGNFPKGTAFTNRTIRYLAQPSFPEAIENGKPGYFSSLLAMGINPLTGENIGAALPASVYMANATPNFMFTSFSIGRNFHQTANIANQNGVVYFPGSTGLYVGGNLAGGFGVSGDGVDQDDIVTFFGSQGYFIPDAVPQADERTFQYQGSAITLPIFRFPRNPLMK
jgi:uncharacterized protein GlcG (DUF336 family)